jgi:hypothetical protein
LYNRTHKTKDGLLLTLSKTKMGEPEAAARLAELVRLAAT